MQSQAVSDLNVARSVGNIAGAIMFLVMTVLIPSGAWYFHDKLAPLVTPQQNNALWYLEGWVYAKVLLGILVSMGGHRYKWIGVGLAYAIAALVVAGMANRYYQIVG